MFERFTKPARYVVEGAVAVAEEQDAAEVGPQHQFLALLDGPEGDVALGVLAGLGATPERLRAELGERRGRYVDGLGEEDAEALAAIGIDLEEVLSRIDTADRRTGRVRRRRHFAKSSKKALELSLREAVGLGHGHIGTEHLLLGLVRGGDPLVVDTLAALEVTPRELRAAVAEVVRRAG